MNPMNEDQLFVSEFLSRLFKIVSEEEGMLSGGIKPGIGAESVQSLLETKISFGNPLNELIHLTPKLFKNLGIKISPIENRQFHKYDFYYLTIIVSLLPGRGVNFHTLDCELDFGPKGTQEPIIHSIFPNSEWRKVLEWGGSMKLMLDSNMNLTAGLKSTDLPFSFSAEMQTELRNEDQVNSFIVVPKFNFEMGRSEILANGEGNSRCFWRIQNPEIKKSQSVKFGVVLKVPKGTKKIVITGKVVAEPEIQWLVANLRDVFEALSKEIKHLLLLDYESRTSAEKLPVGDYEIWEISLNQ